ncbi:Glucan endo-1,3-beta-D-glucosidase [Handroanthus impetiginosus]|uniref:glucan endo-1,3-beta-D-glucosidase n=1 Tax=Handroanthus impetiginosus TaxID=429701 RepID=A0A2G9GNB1_9LAMI|nr:Glucan endo-1,3-beta-D-glucosidase [Handroanthus impetiginosus]
MGTNLQKPSTLPLFSLFLLLSFYSAYSQSFIGVNYGQVADNLPPPEATAKLLKSTSIEKVRLYGADPAIIKALANTGIGIVIGAANGDIPALASDPNFAGNWVNSNVLAYYPASKIIVVSVGNEVVTSPDQNLVSQLLPAMQNVQNALNAASLGGKVKVSTVHSMAVLSQSEPPSSGAFGYADTMKALLQFHSANGSPFLINPYPFFAYQSDSRPDTLAFCLFQPNAGRMDSGTGIKYMNMFDAQVDAIYSALKAMGFKDVEIVVAETGWPYKGDPNEVGPSLENAKAYNGNLINHLRSKVGTPLMPGKSVDTYLFALYDEDLKPGPTSERTFGLFKPDLSMTYDVGLSKSTQTPAPTPATPAPTTPIAPAPTSPVTPVNPAPTTPVTPVNPVPTTPTGPVTPVTPVNPVAGWCVPRPGISDSQLQANLDYACGQGIDCSPIQPGGACFEPATVVSHAAYAMNLLYQSAGRNPWNCDFLQTATITTVNPSKYFIFFRFVNWGQYMHMKLDRSRNT